MTGREFVLPEMVRGKLAAAHGAGADWLASLPHLVADLERRWTLTVGEVLDGGSTSFVARTARGDGGSAILKIAVPGQRVDDQIDVLERAAGWGYARMYAHDRVHQALLLEPLGPSVDRLGLSPEEQVDILCATLHRAWQVPRGPGQDVAPEEEKAAALGRYVNQAWQELGRPCPREVIDRALICSERRAAAFDLDRAVVVHGDPHPGNCLQSLSDRPDAEAGFVFVDPDGFLADPGYDLGVVLRDWCPQLRHDPDLLPRLCRQMADRTGVEPAVIWEWGLLERVSTGLFMMEFGAEPQGRDFLASAALVGSASP